MNFLAHALLAGDSPSLIVGGVVGDWIKGPLPGSLPDDIAQGVALHRAIDSFAELQLSFKRSRTRISPERRRYGGILVDIFYDHLLARNWASIHQQPLAEYCATVYHAIDARLDDLPVAARPALKLMAAEDWLTSYADVDGITDVLARMSRRARRPNPLAQGEQEFLADTTGYTADFHEWLAEMTVYSLRWRQQNDYSQRTFGMAPDIRDGAYELWRLDDNANEFLIERFADHVTADKKLRELSAGGHKQTYWISPAGSTS